MWESIAGAICVLAFCSMLAIMSYGEEKTEQYRIQYGNCK